MSKASLPKNRKPPTNKTTQQRDEKINPNQLTTPEPLRTQIMEAFTTAADPYGNWRSPKTRMNAWRSIQLFDQWLTETNTQTVNVETVENWEDWMAEKWEIRYRLQSHVYEILKQPTWGPEVANAANRPQRSRPEPSGKVISYTDNELEHIITLATAVFTEAEQRIQHNMEEIQKNTPHGQALTEGINRITTKQQHPAHKLRAATLHHVTLNRSEATAALTLLCAETGLNTGPLTNLQTPENHIDNGYIVRVTKNRRKAGSRQHTEIFPNTGPNSSGDIYQRILKATQPARDIATQTNQPHANKLAIFTNHLTGEINDPAALAESWFITWVEINNRAHHYQQTPAVPVSVQRIRRTYLVRNKTPNQHNQATLENTYLMREPRILKELQNVTLAGAANARTWALTTQNTTPPPMKAHIDPHNKPRCAIMLHELEQFRGTSTSEQWGRAADIHKEIRNALNGHNENEQRQARMAATPEDHQHAHKLIQEQQ
jgi:hypothetical protein